MGSNGKPRAQATCHPDKKASAFGLCRQCYHKDYYRRNKELVAGKSRKWKLENQERARENNRRFWLKSQYGLDIETYDKMLATQNGKCNICGDTNGTETGRRLSVDHDHKTGKIRSLLCNACNAVIGHANERIDILQKCIDYLNEHK